ncbi:MAG: MoxR family ATPase [Moorea sp. SIO1F2]|uniref:AAA family ATPase n=1 Tax=unclassified Moorena TaxID=2683338 RepID=UPI0013BE8390|nr:MULTISPECIES: MoxR family ATPase [unclassified Moorena]NEO21944.1 MoxR family ATPase [Moorena sp. SIO4A5]NEQ61111.1 MoxR family ATPase [Moorena sp. SIO4A1]NET85941.1 MoxR family ATPase [Moorena sp. SIO1F2]
MVSPVNKNYLKYTGRVQPKIPGETYQGKLIYPYLPSKELIDAVNLAIYLKRPLLLRGEPGCGKTKLAIAVAYELGLPFEAWYIKSTSRAKDGLYTYDTVGRLRDAQLAASGSLTQAEKQRFDDPTSYVRLGPLGRAFNNDKPTVVLIDEIDKADIDFPNDLLLELEEKIIKIEEVRVDDQEMEISAKAAPIVFITSNDEKDLPDAFLRRCLFHYVKFPKSEQIVHIVKARFPDIADDLTKKSVSRFLELRELMAEETGRSTKKVSTSELLDWIQALKQDTLEEALRKLSQKPLPYLEVLLKSWEAHISYLRLSEDRE